MRQLAAEFGLPAGVIHRDLKPANIMVEGDRLHIMDFGIARSAVPALEQGVSSPAMTLSSSSALLTGATMQGAIVGTVATAVAGASPRGNPPTSGRTSTRSA